LPDNSLKFGQFHEILYNFFFISHLSGPYFTQKYFYGLLKGRGCGQRRTEVKTDRWTDGEREGEADI
jgi:hypothetical protein